MFLLSVGYGNNLLLIFTLVLFSFNLVWLIQTHFHLKKPAFEGLKVHDCFAGTGALFEIKWKNDEALGKSFDFALEVNELTIPVINQVVTFPKRGVFPLSHLKVSTQRPYGLYKAWIYYPLKSEAYVYPEKLNSPPPLAGTNSHEEFELETHRKGAHDFWGLGPYQGEELRKISWKHYARTGEVVVKEGEELASKLVYFRYYEGMPDKELELSKIATQMLYCYQNEISFALETHAVKLSPAKSEAHLKHCLRELARC